jgi:hypothetical protein
LSALLIHCESALGSPGKADLYELGACARLFEQAAPELKAAFVSGKTWILVEYVAKKEAEIAAAVKQLEEAATKLEHGAEEFESDVVVEIPVLDGRGGSEQKSSESVESESDDSQLTDPRGGLNGGEPKNGRRRYSQ